MVSSPSSPITTLCSGKACHCASACFLIWASGINRVGTTLGLHRPSTNSPDFANLPPNQAGIKYRQILFATETYLSEMEIPRRFIDMVVDTNSVDMRWLAYDEAMLMWEVPSISEWIKSDCGAMSAKDKAYMFKYLHENPGPEKRRADELFKRDFKIFDCGAKKIHKARDAIQMSSPASGNPLDWGAVPLQPKQ